MESRKLGQSPLAVAVAPLALGTGDKGDGKGDGGQRGRK